MTGETPPKPTLATMWLDGCSGCHMSFLDMDERLIEIASRIEVVASPYVDTKELPPAIDVAIVEGAVSMVEMALAELSKRSVVQLDEERKAAMVSNLLVVLCSGERAQPVLQVQARSRA